MGGGQSQSRQQPGWPSLRPAFRAHPSGHHKALFFVLFCVASWCSLSVFWALSSRPFFCVTSSVKVFFLATSRRSPVRPCFLLFSELVFVFFFLFFGVLFFSFCVLFFAPCLERPKQVAGKVRRGQSSCTALSRKPVPRISHFPRDLASTATLCIAIPPEDASRCQADLWVRGSHSSGSLQCQNVPRRWFKTMGARQIPDNSGGNAQTRSVHSCSRHQFPGNFRMPFLHHGKAIGPIGPEYGLKAPDGASQPQTHPGNNLTPSTHSALTAVTLRCGQRWTGWDQMVLVSFKHETNLIVMIDVPKVMKDEWN